MPIKLYRIESCYAFTEENSMLPSLNNLITKVVQKVALFLQQTKKSENLLLQQLPLIEKLSNKTQQLVG